MIAASVSIAILIIFYGAYLIGKARGKSIQQRDTARKLVESLARNAEIASRPDIDRPLDRMCKR